MIAQQLTLSREFEPLAPCRTASSRANMSIAVIGEAISGREGDRQLVAGNFSVNFQPVFELLDTISARR